MLKASKNATTQNFILHYTQEKVGLVRALPEINTPLLKNASVDRTASKSYICKQMQHFFHFRAELQGALLKVTCRAWPSLPLKFLRR